MSHTVILFYKFINLEEPNKLLISQRNLCQSLNLKGRIVISSEGINGTLEGLDSDIERYTKDLCQVEEFRDILFKKSLGSGNAFPRLSIKVREEIVTTNLTYNNQLGSHRDYTGKYLSSQELHSWYEEGREFYMVDMRNDYEYQLGHFQDSIQLNNLKHFSDLPKILPEIDHLRDKTIVTCCTGGIRCEKASGFLMYNNFTDVYQLKDGIVTYIEKYPNSNFLGKLYVFDGRMALGFNTDSPDHKEVGKCTICKAQSENIVDYWLNGRRKHGIVCEKCIQEGSVSLKSVIA